MARAFVIDDDPVVRLFLEMALLELGHEVFEAADGVAGIESYRRIAPDFVLCDLHMPLLDGLDTVRELRTIDPQAKIIVMTGGGHTETKNQLALARRYGAVSRINKPFNAAILATTIASVLDPTVELPALHS